MSGEKGQNEGGRKGKAGGQNLLDGFVRLQYVRLHVIQNAADSGSKGGRRRRRPRRGVLSRLRQISTKLPRLETAVGFLFVSRPVKNNMKALKLEKRKATASKAEIGQPMMGRDILVRALER